MFDPENPYVCVYEGYIVDNKDPRKLGRVKVNVPGLLEPESDWALPLGAPGAGGDGLGLWCVPPVGANVTVLFREGDLEAIRYLPGPWPAPRGELQTPSFARDLTPAEAVQVSGLQTSSWNIVLDNRAGAQQLTIESRQFPDNRIVLDSDKQSVEINGTVAVQIRSLGVVSIDALQVVINGRVVLPTGKPI